MRLVGDAHMQRVGVGLRIDRDDAQPEALGGARDAHGDLAAIGDEDGREHGAQSYPKRATKGTGSGTIVLRRSLRLLIAVWA